MVYFIQIYKNKFKKKQMNKVKLIIIVLIFKKIKLIIYLIAQLKVNSKIKNINYLFNKSFNINKITFKNMINNYNYVFHYKILITKI